MTPPSTGALVRGVAVAALLAGGAVLVVAQTGCDDPGSYAQHDDGVVELVGGCLGPEDLVVAPDDPNDDPAPVIPATAELPGPEPAVAP